MCTLQKILCIQKINAETNLYVQKILSIHIAVVTNYKNFYFFFFIITFNSVYCLIRTYCFSFLNFFIGFPTF